MDINKNYTKIKLASYLAILKQFEGYLKDLMKKVRLLNSLMYIKGRRLSLNYMKR